MPDFDSFKAPDTSSLFRARTLAVVRESRLPPVTAADLVDGQGYCAAGGIAAAPAGPEGAGEAQSSASLVPCGLAIDMTECEVVRRAGLPERVELGNNERGERTAVLTYIRGSKPGIYHFVAGRLASMERGPEPPPAPKPAKPTKRTKAKNASL
jgi:hypothetical protein